MSTRRQIQKRGSLKSSFTPPANPLKTRGFGKGIQARSAELPKANPLQTRPFGSPIPASAQQEETESASEQLEIESRFGYNGLDVPVNPPEPPPVQRKGEGLGNWSQPLTKRTAPVMNRLNLLRQQPIVQHQETTEQCPESLPDPVPEGWIPYHGNSSVFHCDYKGIIEDRIPTPDNPQNECFYDDLGQLVDENHPFPDCGGTPNQYDAEENPVEHTVFDSGGILHSGEPAFWESLQHGLVGQDDEVRHFVSHHTDIGQIPTQRKIAMINTLLDGWISDEDVETIGTICRSITSSTESAEVRNAIEPQLGLLYMMADMTSIIQRRRVRGFLSQMP